MTPLTVIKIGLTPEQVRDAMLRRGCTIKPELTDTQTGSVLRMQRKHPPRPPRPNRYITAPISPPATSSPDSPSGA